MRNHLNKSQITSHFMAKTLHMTASCALPFFRFRTFGILFLLGLITLTGCKEDPDAGLDEIEVNLQFRRVDSLMWAAASDLADKDSTAFQEVFERHLASEHEFLAEFIGLGQLVERYRLSPRQADSLMVWEFGRVLSDSAMLGLLDSVRQEFPYDYPLDARFEKPMKRLKREFPDIVLPAFRTHVSGYVPAQEMRQVDQIVPVPGYFSIGLHYFMGPEFPFYSPTLPAYIKRRFDPVYMEVMAFREISEGMVAPLPRTRETTLLDDIIREGIKQYFVEQMLPHTPDSMRFLYNAEQMYWANFYEARIYKTAIDRLFDSNFELKQDYLSDKPYTTDLSMESAPRLGEYLGWRIVHSFMDRNADITLAQLCDRQDYEAIFHESKYRPKEQEGEE